MKEFLIFTIYAPTSSWGDIAVGENRGSWDRPSRSAVLGLVAAALGLTRDDRLGHEDLERCYGVAVRLDVGGVTSVDFHTAQTASAAIVRKRKPATRAQLLDIPDPETILSRRSYRHDALSTIAMWVRSEPRWSLESLSDSLRRPAFVLFAGRKANALGLPLNPELVSAETLAEALSVRPAGWEQLQIVDCEHMRRPRGLTEALEVSHDPCVGFESGLSPLRREVRRDGSPDRIRWQFSSRAVEVGLQTMRPA